MFIFRLLKGNIYLGALAIVILAGKVNSKFCNGGHFCSPPKECCTHGCCYVFSPGYKSPVPQGNSSNLLNLVVWNHWFLWCLLLLLFLSCLGGCGLWRRRQLLPGRWCCRSNRNDEERSEPDSAGSCYPPPHYSRCSFHHAPPPYTEVTSKPDLYPLVISYGSENGKIGENYLMVQYFRNYIVRPTLGSLSAESTVDSLSSNFLCQSTNDVDMNVPPPYEESRLDERDDAQTDPLMSPSLNQLHDVTANKPDQSRSSHFSNNRKSTLSLESKERSQSDLQHVVAQTIHHSIQKASVTVPGSAKINSVLPTPLHTFRTLPSSIQSCSSSGGGGTHQYVECFQNQGMSKGSVSAELPIFKQITRSKTSSASVDLIHENAYAVHQYPPDVILAQPRKYCEQTSELHYHSADVISNPIRSSKFINDSFSSEDNLSQPRGSIQDFVSSDGLSYSQPSNLEINNYSTSSDVSSLQGCGTPDSPPKATSPTGEFMDLLDKIQQLPNRGDYKRSSGSSFHGVSSELYHPKLNKTVNPEGNISTVAVAPSDPEADENTMLLGDLIREGTVENNPSKLLPIRPNKLLFKKNFPSKSKTFYMPFCYNSYSKKRSDNCSNSFSAPVTPVSGFTSPGSIAVNFLLNSKKVGSRKSLEQVNDFSPLLQEEEQRDNNNDEIF